ncbi:MAG: hypothetical protein WDO68_26815 [Gammaproteobacteria bacterium]
MVLLNDVVEVAVGSNQHVAPAAAFPPRLSHIGEVRDPPYVVADAMPLWGARHPMRRNADQAQIHGVTAGTTRAPATIVSHFTSKAIDVTSGLTRRGLRRWLFLSWMIAAGVPPRRPQKAVIRTGTHMLPSDTSRLDTKSPRLWKGVALGAAVLLLLLQAVPVLACMVHPEQALAACCCERGGHCPMGHREQGCAAIDACCAEAVGTGAMGSALTAPPNQRVSAPASFSDAPSSTSPPRLFDPRMGIAAPNFHSHLSVPPPSVPLYLLHLRLTL